MQEHICHQDGDVLGCRGVYPGTNSRTSILRKKARNFPSKCAKSSQANGHGVHQSPSFHHQDQLVHRGPGLDETHPYRKVSDSTDDGHASSYDEDPTHQVASIYEHPDKQTSAKVSKKKRCNPKHQTAWSGSTAEDPDLTQVVDYQTPHFSEVHWDEQCAPQPDELPVKQKKREAKKKGKKPQKPIQLSQPSYVHKLKTEMCKNFALQGWCQWGDQCSYAHGDSELQSKKHLNSNYKRKICVNYHVHGYCAYGLRCQYYHVRDSYQDFLQSALEFISCRIGSVLEDQEASGSKDLASTIKGCAHLTPRLPIFQQMAPDTKTTPSILEQYRCIQQ